MAFGIYVHVPFCRARCPYCDFYFTLDLEPIPAFTRAVIDEARLLAAGRGPGVPPGVAASVYLGGGTPSVLAAGALGDLLEGLRGILPVAPDAEVTVEADPDDLDPGALAAYRRAGVNRLSLGVQSLDDGVLRRLGRRHDAASALAAVAAIREAGIERLSLDLIYAVPGQGLDAWLAVLERAVATGPDHLSCYELTFEPGTPLDRQRLRGRVRPAPDDERHAFFEATSRALTARGWQHYEVSSFAREPGARSRHNRSYWVHRPYLGLGPSAHSFDGRTRRWNHRSLGRYLADLEAGVLPVADSERLSGAQLRAEEILLGLRTEGGFRRGDLPAGPLERLVAGGYLEPVPDRPEPWLRPTPSGMVVADALALELVPDP